MGRAAPVVPDKRPRELKLTGRLRSVPPAAPFFPIIRPARHDLTGHLGRRLGVPRDESHPGPAPMTPEPSPDPVSPTPLAAWSAELRPRGPVEAWLVARAARASTRVDRLADAADAIEARDADDPSLRRLRRDEAAERCLHQSLALLARGRKQGLWASAVEARPAAITAGAPRIIESPDADELWPSPRALASSLVARIGNPAGDRPTALPTFHPRI